MTISPVVRQMVFVPALAPCALSLYHQPSHLASSPKYPSRTLGRSKQKYRLGCSHSGLSPLCFRADFSMTFTLENLPPNTFKADICPVFQRFGEVRRIVIGLGGTRADIIFAGPQGVKRTLQNSHSLCEGER
ncbi:hypothetical protein EDB89DRAFT_972669 [Lactarius sanguifluus]|nr:hypothetical protein EDB89DRAFT_972669 [Lactarius sanguifluus]